mmetsp:Transcript_33413/g.54293  ORF Transcript_33413/g.54293 Transcript_33413/m.54293 type:complete len:92 (+) Transcript_33413:250-525(+)
MIKKEEKGEEEAAQNRGLLITVLGMGAQGYLLSLAPPSGPYKNSKRFQSNIAEHMRHNTNFSRIVTEMKRLIEKMILELQPVAMHRKSFEP